MKAEDTVKRVEPHSESIWCPHCGEEFGIESKIEDERKEQAEISFSLGERKSDRKWRQILKDSVALAKLAGVNEVVEWLRKDCPDEYGSWKEWSVFQSKLEEWGISDGK